MNIAKIDKNFEVQTQINKDDIVFYDVDEAPFKVYGVFRENGQYRRMPKVIADGVSENVRILHTNTAGGRVRFATDSRYVAISAKMTGIGKMPHFALTGSAGFDLYVDQNYKKTFIPPVDIKDGFEDVIDLPTVEMREITINFPLYSNVEKLYVGLQRNAEIKGGLLYVNEKPIVYYGSSITQGGCASRPGMSYQNIISRELNCDFINLGFSGGAKAEPEMIEYVRSLDMSVFVYDYDYNAPTIEHLESTHKKMFAEVRKSHPDIPIIIMPRPKYRLNDEEVARFDIIRKTYDDAVASGDKNVYLIDGKMLTELCKDEGTVDGIHPTDFGFASMAKVLCKYIKKVL